MKLRWLSVYLEAREPARLLEGALGAVERAAAKGAGVAAGDLVTGP